jgi:hypothetical protein
LGNCDSLKLETCLNYFTQLTAVSNRGLLRVPSVAYGTCDRARRTGESCLILQSRSPFQRQETLVSIATECALAGRATANMLKTTARTAIRAVHDRLRVSTCFGTMPSLSCLLAWISIRTTWNARTLTGPELASVALPQNPLAGSKGQHEVLFSHRLSG